MVGKRAIPTMVTRVSCNGCTSMLRKVNMHVVFRHHVVMLSRIIGPTLPYWHCHNDMPYWQPTPPRPISARHLTLRFAHHTLGLTRRIGGLTDVETGTVVDTGQVYR